MSQGVSTGPSHGLRWRLIGALAIIAPVLGLLWLDGYVNFGRPGIWLLSFGALVSGTALGELHHLASAAGQTRFPAFRSILLGELSLAIAGLPIIFPGLWIHPGRPLGLGRFGDDGQLDGRVAVGDGSFPTITGGDERSGP